MLYSLLFALSLSVDAMGIGMSYGVRNIAVPKRSMLLLGLETFFMLGFFLWTGEKIAVFFPPNIAEKGATVFLLLFGLWLCYQGLRQKRDIGSPVGALQQPSDLDKDGSKALEPREALFLGFILSLDSLGVGISIAASGVKTVGLAFFAAVFQIIFLYLGDIVGKKTMKGATAAGEGFWSVISGGIILVIAVFRFL